MANAVLSVNWLFLLLPLTYALSCVVKIEVGSTNVRVGSIIFGNREYPNSAANTPSPSPEKKSKVLSEEAAKKMEHLTVSEHWKNSSS